MDSNQEPNPDLLYRKSKQAHRIAIVFCFLLAFFWPVGAFFAWIFLGTAVYFGFLGWYYNYHAAPREYSTTKPSASPTSEVPKGLIQIIRYLPFIMGLVIFGIIARLVFSNSTPEDETIKVDTQEVDSEKRAANENSTNDLDALTNRGNEFYNQGKFDSALFYYDRVLTIDPSNQFAQYDKALVYYAQKNYNRSVPILIRCLYRHPDYGEAFWLLGDNYYDRHRLDSAKICFELAYEKGIRDGGFLQLMASLYEADARPKAIELYKESIHQDSTLLDSYRKLAELDPSQRDAYQRMMTKWNPK